MIQVGMYVTIASIQRTGRVLQLADYHKDGNGDSISRPHSAVVMFNDKSGALYPFDMMTVVDPPAEKPQEQHDQPRKEQEPAIVWRWCPVCWDRTDHKLVGDLIHVCSVCGHRVEKWEPDRSSSYIVPTEDDEKLPEMAGSQQVAAG